MVVHIHMIMLLYSAIEGLLRKSKKISAISDCSKRHLEACFPFKISDLNSTITISHVLFISSQRPRDSIYMSGDLSKFRGIKAASVSDALEKVGIIRGVVAGIRPLFPEARILGPAVTIRQAPARTTVGKSKVWDMSDSVANKGDVIVVDTGGNVDYATWAGNVSLKAMVRGVEGVVVDGAVRDVDEIVGYRFAVFTRGYAPTRSAAYFDTIGINEPVKIGNSYVRPGDLIVGDISGIAVVPTEKVEEVFKFAQIKEKMDEMSVPLYKKGKTKKEVSEFLKKEGLEL
jgi:4-hydroxy-4-methyl-2-oxoglutarate aldolase